MFNNNPTIAPPERLYFLKHINYNSDMVYHNKNKGFTLAEVLITLGIIGVVASLTLPSLINSYKDRQYKVAYKKAYSDIQNAFQDAIFEGELIRNGSMFQIEATKQEFEIMKSNFKVIKDCGKLVSKCWEKGDSIGGGSMSSSTYPIDYQSSCFIDASGRNWCTYFDSENIFVVDTNGSKLPNRFGKDRWIFTFVNSNGNRSNIATNYKRIGILINGDVNSVGTWCHNPPCKYKSWLYE